MATAPSRSRRRARATPARGRGSHARARRSSAPARTGKARCAPRSTRARRRLRYRRQNVGAVAATVVLAGMLGLAVMSPRGQATPVVPDEGATAIAQREIPQGWLARYQDAARDCPGLPWAILAGVGRVESGHGTNTGPSSAGALGPMQFLPATWRAYGVDADGDGVADVHDPDDAVHGAARYLCANGGGNPATLRTALWNYNHADWYVDKVIAEARRYGPVPAQVPAQPPDQAR